MASRRENSATGPTCNPWDLDSRVPGGSSGRQRAALAPAKRPTLGFLTPAGSIRQTAGVERVVGFEDDVRLVSRYGLIAVSSSRLDADGAVFCADRRDAASSSAAIDGTTTRDSKSVHAEIARFCSSRPRRTSSRPMAGSRPIGIFWRTGPV